MNHQIFLPFYYLDILTERDNETASRPSSDRTSPLNLPSGIFIFSQVTVILDTVVMVQSVSSRDVSVCKENKHMMIVL